MIRRREEVQTLGHMFMAALLALILAIFIKANYLYTDDSYNYLIALALPITILTVLFWAILYQRYLLKLQDSHKTVYGRLLTLSIVFSALVIAFIILFSIYLNSPSKNQDMLIASLIPYYIALLIAGCVLIYLSPGLCDKINGIPVY